MDIVDKDHINDDDEKKKPRPSKRQKLNLDQAKALFLPSQNKYTKQSEQNRSSITQRKPKPLFPNDQKDTLQKKVRQLERKIEEESLSEAEELSIINEIAKLEEQISKKT